MKAQDLAWEFFVRKRPEWAACLKRKEEDEDLWEIVDEAAAAAENFLTRCLPEDDEEIYRVNLHLLSQECFSLACVSMVLLRDWEERGLAEKAKKAGELADELVDLAELAAAEANVVEVDAEEEEEVEELADRLAEMAELAVKEAELAAKEAGVAYVAEEEEEEEEEEL